MKSPKYIEKALEQRRKYAIKLMQVNSIVDNYIMKNHLDEEIELYDFGTGAEIFCNPYDSERRVKNAILNHKR